MPDRPRYGSGVAALCRRGRTRAKWHASRNQAAHGWNPSWQASRISNAAADPIIPTGGTGRIGRRGYPSPCKTDAPGDPSPPSFARFASCRSLSGGHRQRSDPAHHPKEPSDAAAVCGDGEDRTVAVGCILTGRRKSKMEIRVMRIAPSYNTNRSQGVARGEERDQWSDMEKRVQAARAARTVFGFAAAFALALGIGGAQTAAGGGKSVALDPAEYVARAEKGDVNAQLVLAGMYLQGRVVGKNLTEAARWYGTAANQGSAQAQSALGVLFLTGQGVEKDIGKALEWLEKAAAQENSDAQYNLGTIYLQGSGVPADNAKAISWFRKAAENGHVWSQMNLAGAYYEGRGVPQDYAEAARWCRKAADGGDAEAQFRFGMMYLKGQGVPQSNRDAEHWIRQSAAKGYGPAASILKQWPPEK